MKKLLILLAFTATTSLSQSADAPIHDALELAIDVTQGIITAKKARELCRTQGYHRTQIAELNNFLKVAKKGETVTVQKPTAAQPAATVAAAAQTATYVLPKRQLSFFEQMQQAIDLKDFELFLKNYNAHTIKHGDLTDTQRTALQQCAQNAKTFTVLVDGNLVTVQPFCHSGVYYPTFAEPFEIQVAKDQIVRDFNNLYNIETILMKN